MAALFRCCHDIVLKMPRDTPKKRGKKKGKFRRSSNTGQVLSDQDLQFLVEKTSFDAGEIAEWFRLVSGLDDLKRDFVFLGIYKFVSVSGVSLMTILKEL